MAFEGLSEIALKELAPVIGCDLGAAGNIFEMLRRMVLLVSPDMPENDLVGLLRKRLVPQSRVADGFWR